MALITRVSRRIRVARLEAGLTQQQLADRTRLDVRYISRLETNPQNLKLDKIERIARALKVSEASLIGSEDSESSLDRSAMVILDEIAQHLAVLRARLQE